MIELARTNTEACPDIETTLREVFHRRELGAQIVKSLQSAFQSYPIFAAEHLGVPTSRTKSFKASFIHESFYKHVAENLPAFARITPMSTIEGIFIPTESIFFWLKKVDHRGLPKNIPTGAQKKLRDAGLLQEMGIPAIKVLVLGYRTDKNFINLLDFSVYEIGGEASGRRIFNLLSQTSNQTALSLAPAADVTSVVLRRTGTEDVYATEEIQDEQSYPVRLKGTT